MNANPSNTADPFAKALPKGVFTRIAPKLKYKSIKSGERIDITGKIFFLKSGEIEIIGLHEGKEVVIETLFSGDLFGDFFPEKANLVEIQAISRMSNSLCYVTTPNFWEIIDTTPYLAKLFMKYLIEKQELYHYKIFTAPLPARHKIMYEIELLETKLKQSFWGKLFNIPLKILLDPKTKGVHLQRKKV